MSDVGVVLQLWRELSDAGQDWILATLIRVEGSSYRRPGARMLVAADGRRAGTISGGCLEAEVAKQAFWLTAGGATVRTYTMAAEDDDSPHPYGLGCGGKLHILLERKATSGTLLEWLYEAYTRRHGLKTTTIVSGERLGSRTFITATEPSDEREHACYQGETQDVYVEELPARVGLFVFGAGDDVVPLVEIARLQDWYIEVADGRSHLATKARFSRADQVHVASEDYWLPQLQRRDAAVIMSHSFDQDTAFLQRVLDTDAGYIGILGPRHRTVRIIEAITASTGQSSSSAWFRLHAPVGLPLGERTPAAIALGIAGEITLEMNQQTTSPEARREGLGRQESRASAPSTEEQNRWQKQ